VVVSLVTVGTTFFLKSHCLFLPRPQPVPRFCTPVCFPPYHWLGTGSLIRRHEPRASSQLAKSRASSHPGSKSKSPDRMVGQNFHPAAPGLGRFFPGGGIGGRPALSTAVRTRVLEAWSMEWREPLINYGPCSIMEAGLAWGTCTIRFHNQAKVGTWWFGSNEHLPS